ncbi:hypothetical protein ElyMa_005932400 [Elysia marginata]|uniref:Uncharacterized protein n=1 Tax=Elysia marginata TaxID=1093978 RepID=A0AAV4G7V4_9GAST|nr:hypothetical protein ElyMa_005932400 [Elysia marginata]
MLPTGQGEEWWFKYSVREMRPFSSIVDDHLDLTDITGGRGQSSQFLSLQITVSYILEVIKSSNKEEDKKEDDNGHDNDNDDNDYNAAHAAAAVAAAAAAAADDDDDDDDDDDEYKYNHKWYTLK